MALLSSPSSTHMGFFGEELKPPCSRKGLFPFARLLVSLLSTGTNRCPSPSPSSWLGFLSPTGEEKGDSPSSQPPLQLRNPRGKAADASTLKTPGLRQVGDASVASPNRSPDRDPLKPPLPPKSQAISGL